MDTPSELFITSNQIEEGSPAEFLLRVREITTPLRQLREDTDDSAPLQLSTVLFEKINVELTSENHKDCTIALHRDNQTTTIQYTGNSLFVHRADDEEPQQMRPDSEGFGVIQFVNTILDQTYKETHPGTDTIW